MQTIKYLSAHAWQQQFAEHHLFRNICHVHYRRIAPILEKTTKEFGLFYNLKPAFFTALASNIVRLKEPGQPIVLTNQYANHSN
jgi:fatty acid desaturase